MTDKCTNCDVEWHTGYALAEKESQEEIKLMLAENERLNDEVDRLKALLDDVIDIAKGA